MEAAKALLEKYIATGPDDSTLPILSAALEHLPKDGKANLVKDTILSFKTNNGLWGHAGSIRTTLLIPMKAESKTPSKVMSPREGLEDLLEDLASTFANPRNRDGRMRSGCLRRDGNKCTVTWRVDKQYVSHTDRATLCGQTECAHIIPLSVAEWNSESEMEAKLGIWISMKHYFPVLKEKINFDYESINNHRNGITMLDAVHTHFLEFEIAFEATETLHTYRLVIHRPNIVAISLPSHVTFASQDGRYELPNPELLEIHASIARILHASGQSWEINKILRDLDDTSMLAKDGSTDIAALLTATSLSALSLSQNSPDPDPEQDLKPRPRKLLGQSSGKFKVNVK